jgi:hypothetical protein
MDTCKRGHRKRDAGWSTEWRTGPPRAFVQWKGTDVCMDVYCLCEEQFHVDADFAYAVRCPHCNRVLEMKSVIEMREIDERDWTGCPIVDGE